MSAEAKTPSGLGSSIFLYGPSGSGKSTVGRLLAEALELPFSDLDERIEARVGLSIPEIFARDGEAGFRQREREMLQEACALKGGVIALGGGALLDDTNRAAAQSSGAVVCLAAPYETLLVRLQGQAEGRPLLSTDLPQRLRRLLEERQAHYASFNTVETAGMTPSGVAWEVQRRLGWFRVRGMGEAYDVRVKTKGLESLGTACLERGLKGPLALVSDENVARWHAPTAIASLELAGYRVHLTSILPGEAHKTITTVQQIWEQCTAAGLERQSTLIALGGGVVNDLAGFAAATWLRGVRWVACPTSLLAMVDASLGGKTGVDLPQGKNLVGAFHSPALVLADPACLLTLPEGELRSGLAEVVKHGVIADPLLFQQCADLPSLEQFDGLISRAIAVKVQVIQADPYEKGPRAALNLGHTLGHALEQVSGYSLRHGEAVAIGMVCAAKLAQGMGLAEAGLAEEIGAVLDRLGLPTRVPLELDRAAILAAMQRDKKRAGGKLRFVLPKRIGEVIPGVEMEESLVMEIL